MIATIINKVLITIVTITIKTILSLIRIVPFVLSWNQDLYVLCINSLKTLLNVTNLYVIMFIPFGVRCQAKTFRLDDCTVVCDLII